MKKCCDTCKFYDYDGSTGTSDCSNEEIEEEEIDLFYCEGIEGCPHWVPKYTEEEIAEEEEYLQQMRKEMI